MKTRGTPIHDAQRSGPNSQVVPWALLYLLAAGLVGIHGATPLHAQTDGIRGAQPVSGGRVALVLGNAAYTSIPPLQNSANDAEDFAAALHVLGFDVIRRIDQPRDEMFEAIRTFAVEADGADVALLFYAGHGVEVGGENYLIPVDVGRFTSEDFRVDEEAIPLGQIVQAMKRASTQVIMLDACRNNPFPLNGGQSTSSRGWAMPAPDQIGGTLVAYGTALGAVASDNVQGRNGLFTEALLQEIHEPGLEAAELMRRVTERVREKSDFEQSPWLSASYVLPFYFIDPEPGQGPDRLATAPASDVRDWAEQGSDAYDAGNYRKALPLLRQAARAGHTESQYNLGKMYLAGRGVDEDASQAADWFELASMQGHPQAQYFLGGMYSGGFGDRPRDDNRAAELYQRAAEQGFSVGQFRLGLVYESGRGRSKNVDEALRWYLLAARQDHDQARHALERLAKEGNTKAKAMLRLLEPAGHEQ